MKKGFRKLYLGIALGLILALGITGVVYALHVDSATATWDSGSPVYGTVTNVTYIIGLVHDDAAPNGEDISFSITWTGDTPAGVTHAFVPVTVPEGGGSTTLTITTAADTPAGIYPFTVTATDTAGSVNHKCSQSCYYTLYASRLPALPPTIKCRRYYRYCNFDSAVIPARVVTQ